MPEILPPFWHPVCSKGFILDWDGVLADTRLDFQGIRDRYFGGRRVPLIESDHLLTPEQRENLEKDLYDLEMEGASRAIPVEGAHELLEWLDSEQIPRAVVSRNCMDSIRKAARKCDIRLPEHVFSRDEGPLKPDPEALWAAAEAIGVPEDQCVVVGDFLYDLYGARRAGMRAVLVERHEKEWLRWTDAGFKRLPDLVESLRKPKPLVPWEYKDLARTRGSEWLQKAWKLEVRLSGEQPEAFHIALRAAGLGVGCIVVSPYERISLEQWNETPFLPREWTGRLLIEGLARFLGERFPQIRIRSGKEGLALPARPEETDRFLAGVIR
ncbi:MAG: HAD family hydrolase [Thermovirgaceae bacterium]